MKVGLRVDVDTFRGTRVGAPRLSRLLAEQDARATFFFSVGPDNMGRHVWRLLRPAFAWKMLRSGAPTLYGWDILLRGTFSPGPRIGERLAHVIRDTQADGHEVGLHAWDHHAWQACVDGWDDRTIYRHVEQGVVALTDILGRPPTCSAAPAWRCNDRVLDAKARFPFEFNSDCRGHSVFAPVFLGSRTLQPQVPVTLPTYDELVGRSGMSGAQYYEHLVTLLEPGKLNVLAIHAEVEGASRSREFAVFVEEARSQGWTFVPLGGLAAEVPSPPPARIEKTSVPGREGWVSCQVAI